MTLSVDRGSWCFRQFDTYDDLTAFRFRFSRWVESAGRDDLAAVEIIDPWTNGRGETVAEAVLAARHVGTDLRSLDPAELPAHVHILTSDVAVAGVERFDPNALSRAAWATVAPVDAVLPELPAFRAATIRPDPSIG